MKREIKDHINNYDELLEKEFTFCAIPTKDMTRDDMKVVLLVMLEKYKSEKDRITTRLLDF